MTARGNRWSRAVYDVYDRAYSDTDYHRPNVRLTKIDINEIIDRSKIGFQIGIFALCLLCLVIDGFDIQVLGYLAPAIAADWDRSRAPMDSQAGSVQASRQAAG